MKEIVIKILSNIVKEKLQDASSMESNTVSQENIASIITVQKSNVSTFSVQSENEIDGLSLADFFKSKGLEVIDKRANGGCLWVIVIPEQLESYLSIVANRYGVIGHFASGKATKQRLGWYTKSDK